jgi:filamentous hemagglutinin family protein
MKRKMWWLKRSSSPHLFARYLMLFCALGVIFLPTSYVWANPVGEQVVGGAAAFQRDGNKLTVNQATDRLAVNWQSFNIGAGESTHFNMPSSTSAALNRVIGGNPSSIYGSLSANGILYLINPSGILVGPGGTVNAASFMASTLDVSTEQFMNGKGSAGMRFTGPSGESIVNQGNITAEKGDVFLVAQKVENRGTINAANGTAGMVGSGQATDVMVHEVGGNGFAIRVAQLQGEAATGSNRDLPDGEELLNEGTINAAQAELNASGNVYALAIRNSGTIRAKAVVANADGTVRLDGGLGDVINTGKMYAKNAGDDATAAGGKIDVTGQNITASPESIITAAGGELGGNGGSVKIDSQDTTIVQGKVDVAAPSAGAKGGKVQLLGERVGLFDGAKVDASGGAGGGTVLVGGDYLGGQTPKPELKDLAKQEAEPVKNAKATVMADTAEIKADATASGDGGKIVLWSDEYTGFYGDLFARGGAEGGNGGFIETSSKNNLQVMGSVMVGSLLGNRGLWLLDPYDVTISASATTGGTPNPVVAGSTWVPNTTGSNILNTQINTALNTGSVTVTTTSSAGNETGDITVLGAISSGGSAGGSLTLLAAGAITISSDISIGLADLNLNTEDGLIVTYANADITTTSGDVKFNSAGGTITLNGTITTGSSTVRLITDDQDIILNNAITSDGNVSLNGKIITLNGDIDVSGATGAGVGGVTIDATRDVSGTGEISLAEYYDPTTGIANAIDGGLVIRSTGGGVQAFINTPVSFDQTLPSDIWNPRLAGPPIAVSASGVVNLVNQGVAGSTLTVGSFGGTGGITSTGAVTLAAGDGNLILGLGANTVSGASFSGSSSETTSGIIFAEVSSRLNPVVNTTGRQNYNGVVTLNTGGLTVLSGDGLNFNGTINDGSINTTASGLTPGTAVGDTDKHIATTGSESLLLLNTGVTRFQDLVGTALVAATTGNLAYLSLGPLANFAQDGGTVEFLADGTAPAPDTNGAGLALNGSTTGPSIYTTGSLGFGLGAKILLSANTYLSAYYDIYFGGTVDTSTGPNAPYTFTVTTFDGSATPGVTIGGGQIIFDGAIGATGPLGALTVTAAGTDGNGKGAQININVGATTFTGTNPIPDGGNGAITLTADGAVILAGTIETNSSETIGGGLTVESDFSGYSSVTDNKNIQIGATINTRGGAIDFLSPVFFTAASNLNTTVGNSGGAITFASTTDGSAQATMNSGNAKITFGTVPADVFGQISNFNLSITGAGGVEFLGDALLGAGANSITSLAGNVVFGSKLDIRNAGTLTMNLGKNEADFTGAVGSTNPFGMTVSSAGGVTFSDAVRLGGAFAFNQLSGPFVANSSISGGFGLTINPVSSGATLTFQEVGTKVVAGVETLVPVASLTIGNGNSAIFLNGNITTSGGLINFGSPVTVNESIVLNTTARGASGGAISFLNSVKAGADPTLENLTIQAGQGALSFGDEISGFNVFAVNSAGGMNFSSSGSVSAGVISINTDVISQRNVRLTTTSGDLTIFGGLSARPSNSNGEGGDAILNSAAKIEIGGLVDVSGRSGTFTIVLPDGSGTYTIATVGFKGGEVNFTAAGDITIGAVNAIGGNNFATGGNGGDGGDVFLTSGGSITTSTILANGGSNGGIGGAGGEIILTRTSGTGNFNVASLASVGGDGDDQGGNGGDITLTANIGNLRAPISYLNQGGEAATGNIDTRDLFSGNGGNVSLNATLGSVYFQGQTLTMQGNSSLDISAGTSVVLATDLVAKSGGVVITTNEGALKDSPRGSIAVKYGVGEFYMPSSAYLVTQGGDAKVYSTTLGAGAVTISGINTSGTDVNGGSIKIHQEAGSVLGVVNVLGALETSGATPVLPPYGRSGGSVNISGTAVSVNQIDTTGSSSLASATAPAFGGAGGDVTITGTTITITSGTSSTGTALSISTSGGAGLGTKNATGGAGGSISLNGNVVLNSGDSTRTTVIFDTQGGTYTGGASNGVGGNIALSGTLTGTKTTSNILDLRYGSGTVTLGDAPADTITLGTLITAGDDARSTGSLIINGALDLDTLTTFARGYSLSTLGGGTIANRVTFLNTGTTRIGATGVTTTFTDGFDALNGTTAPSTLQLGGTINTVTATTGSMLANTTELVANTTLNSAGNIIQFGSLDGTYGLTLAAGVAGGSTTVSGAVGDTTQVGQITIASGVTGLVKFDSTVEATGIQSAATSQLSFNNDVTLSGVGGATTNLGGTLTLNNAAYVDDLTAVLSFLGAGAKTFSGATTLSGGPIEFGGLGNYTVTGTINGAQNLTLSGLGTKTFTAIVGGTTALGTGTGAAISMSGGNVAFGKLTTASGIVSSANVALTDTTTLAAGDTASSLTGDVDLLGATLTSAGNIGLGDSAADSVKLDGAVLVNGAGAVNVGGAVTDNIGFTSFTQAGTAGKISFDENVTLDVAAGLVTLNGNVGLSGMSFSTAGTVTLGNALTDSITLTTAAVTLTGTGTFAVNGVVVGGSQNLTLSGAGGKTFAGAMSDLGTLGLTAGTGTFNKTVSGVAFNQSGGVAVLNGNGTFTGASTLGGTSTTLNGITFSSGTTAVTGVLTSTGATTMTGGVITLNTASAVTSSSGVLTMGSAVSLGQATTLNGAGQYQLNGAVNGANSLTLDGAGAKTFSGEVGTGTALTTITQNNASGLVTFADDVTMSGAGAFNANLVLAGLTLTSTGSTLTLGDEGTDTAVISGATTIQTTGKNITLNSATTLNSALTLSDVGAVGGTTTLSGTVAGKSSNLTVTTDNLTIANTVQTGSGVVSLFKKDGLALTVGGVAPGFLNATEISRISTSGGLTVGTGGNITIYQLVSGDTDQITGAFRMVTTGGDIDVAQPVQLNVFSGSAIAGELTATGSTLTARLATRGFQDVVLGVGGLSYDGTSSMNLSGIQVRDGIQVSSTDAMTVNGSVISGTGNVDLQSLNSNLNVLGTVTSAGSMELVAGRNIRISSLVSAPDAVLVDAGGYFINSYSGNPFRSADTRVATADLFGATWPSNGAVPGLQVVYGVSDAALVGANQVGVSTTLLAGNGAPYILEFTTGTGQPYIFAQQAAVPPVMLPAALTGGSGFTKAISYSADEIEMMTPEERSAYENQQRRVSARVILQSESGEGEEIGAPTEGRTPQAAIPAVRIPVAPTAQVLLEGKPLAGAKSDQERGDAKKILKIRPTRSVALRSGLNVNEVMESERMAAEVSVGSAPVVQNR